MTLDSVMISFLGYDTRAWTIKIDQWDCFKLETFYASKKHDRVILNMECGFHLYAYPGPH